MIHLGKPITRRLHRPKPIKADQQLHEKCAHCSTCWTLSESTCPHEQSPAGESCGVCFHWVSVEKSRNASRSVLLLVVFIRVQRLVRDFITLYPLQEILHDALSVPFGVIWAGHLHVLCERDACWGDWQSHITGLLVIELKDLNASFTRMFVAMTSGSSHIDSTKNTWKRTWIVRNSEPIWKRVS